MGASCSIMTPLLLYAVTLANGTVEVLPGVPAGSSVSVTGLEGVLPGSNFAGDVATLHDQTGASLTTCTLPATTGIPSSCSATFVVTGYAINSLVDVSALFPLATPFLFGGGGSYGPDGLTVDCGTFAVVSPGQAPYVAPTPPPPSSAATTGLGSAYSDPYFSGLWHQLFYVHGRAGAVYALLSDHDVQLNARLVFLASVSCPELDVPGQVHCSDHPGTYFGQMGVKTSKGDTLRIHAGGVADGFASVEVNGVQLAVGDSYGELPSASAGAGGGAGAGAGAGSASGRAYSVPVSSSAPHPHPHPHSASHLYNSSSLYVRRTSPRSLLVRVGLYALQVDNSDRYLDLVSTLR